MTVKNKQGRGKSRLMTSFFSADRGSFKFTPLTNPDGVQIEERARLTFNSTFGSRLSSEPCDFPFRFLFSGFRVFLRFAPFLFLLDFGWLRDGISSLFPFLLSCDFSFLRFALGFFFSRFSGVSKSRL
jgi:hypothetical protein